MSGPPAPRPPGSRGDTAATTEREWYSVQEGFWKSLWLVLRGYRVRQLKYLPPAA